MIVLHWFDNMKNLYSLKRKIDCVFTAVTEHCQDDLKMFCQPILVPRGRDPFGQHQGSRPLVGAEFLSMRRVLTLHFQPIKFTRFNKEFVMRRVCDHRSESQFKQL